MRYRGLVLTIAGLVTGALLVGGGLAVAEFVRARPDPGAGAGTDRTDAPTGTPAVPDVASASPASTGTASRPAPTTNGSVDSAVVPLVVGHNAAQAVLLLGDQGFHQVQLVSEYASGQPVDEPAKWTVVKQSVEAGTRAAPATVIVLTCVRGY